MRIPRIIIGLSAALILTLTVGCSNSDNDPPDTAASSSSAAESDSGAPLDQEPDRKPEDVHFRPVIAARPADAGAPADSPKKLRHDFAVTDCTEEPTTTRAKKGTVACGMGDTKYLLGPAVVVNSLTAARAVEFQGEWVVALIVTSDAQRTFETLAESAQPPVIAIEQGGTVLQVRGITQLADKGRTGIDGNFDEQTAAELADVLSATIDS